MRFSSSTWFLGERSVKEALEVIARCGFTAAEVWMEHLLRTGEPPEEVRERAQTLAMSLSLHGASYDLNVASVNPGIRQESLRQVHQSIITAAHLGAAIVVLHPGRLSASRGSVDDCWQWLTEAVALMDQWASQEGVCVGLEAMEKRAKEIYVTPADVRRMLSKGWRNVGLTLDIAHAYTLMDPVDYMAQLDDAWITHVHLSDSTAERVHVPLGRGQLDVSAALTGLSQRYQGVVNLEGYVPGRGEETICHNFAYLQRLGWV
ncbi:MAG: sugar phosphate isomerase/epimerase [Anaerolineales bacterium]|nr:MAG: sugar phosphate isomerase/epimerase [Anaerolineales bacterium]